jgi:glucan phosphorylase
LNKSFILIEPGVNPRKWIHNCNRDKSALITEYIDDESEWLTHMQLLRPLINQIEEHFVKRLVDADHDIRLLALNKLLEILMRFFQ